MTIETPDVVVVGLGPAGSRAAATAAAAGLASSRWSGGAPPAHRCNAQSSCRP